MIIPGLSYEEYCQLPGINSSLLKVVSGSSMLHARAYLDGKLKKESDALDFGHSFHEMLLRGNEDFVTRPDTYPAPAKHEKVKAGEIKEGDPLPWNANAGVCKTWIKENANGKTVHTQNETDSLRGMVEAVKANAELAPHLDGECELAVTGERNGVAYKSLIDLLPRNQELAVVDFKKCVSANPRVFVPSAVKYGYLIQAALNLDVLAWNGQKRSQFWFVAVEDSAPFAISIMKLRDEPLRLLRVGRSRYRDAVKLILESNKTGQWSSYSDYDPEEYAPAYIKDEIERTA